MSLPLMDTPTDWVRVVIIFVCVFALVGLGRRFYQHHNSWNVKTKDYWFALTMWVFAGGELLIEGLYYNIPFGPRIVFFATAALVTLKGLLRKGEWGTRES